MELTRRRFAMLLGSAALAALAGASAILRLRPGGAWRAKAGRFPGRVRPLDAAAVGRPGPWAG